jgi:hypothetical protein
MKLVLADLRQDALDRRGATVRRRAHHRAD